MELKVGSILIAKEPCIMRYTDDEALIVGKEYPIDRICGKNIIINSEIDKEHIFEMEVLGKFFDVKQ